MQVVISVSTSSDHSWARLADDEVTVKANLDALKRLDWASLIASLVPGVLDETERVLDAEEGAIEIHCPLCDSLQTDRESFGWWRCYECGHLFEYWTPRDAFYRDFDLNPDTREKAQEAK